MIIGHTARVMLATSIFMHRKHTLPGQRGGLSTHYSLTEAREAAYDGFGEGEESYFDEHNRTLFS